VTFVETPVEVERTRAEETDGPTVADGTSEHQASKKVRKRDLWERGRGRT